MKITPALKERFCKDLQIPIKIFQEPYFTERLELYDKHFDCLEKYNHFCEMLSEFNDEQEYFAVYNGLKDRVIEYLNSNEIFMFFSQKEDMSKFAVENKNFPKNSIYRQDHIGKHFISFDICKGNFTALRHYSPDIFQGKETYEDFMKMFTDNEHLINSKYIRQVIFGAVNPNRQVRYEEYLMNKVLESILTFFNKSQIVYFSTDEIVVNINEPVAENSETQKFITDTVNIFNNQGNRIRGEVFSLSYFEEFDVYVKDVYFKTFTSNGKKIKNSDIKVIKNANHLTMPFVLRKMYNLPANENDNVFLHEGRLAKFID